jgi:hypothetical protein
VTSNVASTLPDLRLAPLAAALSAAALSRVLPPVPPVPVAAFSSAI